MIDFVLIIDDGVNPQLYNTHLALNLEITKDLEVRPRQISDPYAASHGTACAAIIHKYAPSAPLGSLKVLDEGIGRGLRDQLVKALEWCADNGVKLVNLSLGTIDFRDYEPVRQAVNYAYKKGVVIVAACNNRDIFTCPASLTNVIGVKCDKTGALKEGEYVYNMNPADGVEIIACGEHRLLKYNGEEKNIFPSNSFAAPMITAKVYDIMTKHPGITLDGIKEELRKGAVNGKDTKPLNGLVNRIDWLDNAVIFNTGANNIESITALKPVNQIYLDCQEPRNIFNKILGIIEQEPDFLKLSDTLVINIDRCFDKISRDVLKDFILNIDEFNKASPTVKNVVLLHDDGKDWGPGFLGEDSSVFNGKMRIWHPLVHRLYYTDFKHREVDIPIISVQDLSGNSVINAVQKLKELFRQDGYYAVGVSDTSLGILYGLEYVPDPRELEVIYAVYDADLIIYGLDYAPNRLLLENSTLQPDIRLIIVNSSMDYEGLLPKHDTDCETIVAVEGEKPYSEEKGAYVFHYSAELPLEDIYKLMLKLFLNDD